MANGDNPLPGLPNWAQTLTPAAPDITAAPAPPPTPQAAPPGQVSSNPLPSPAPIATPTLMDQSSGPMPLPAPYNQPANRGGVVKNALTRMFYGMGQAMLEHVGLPTDYDIQKTQYNQALQANELQLRHAQLAMQYQMVTLPNGVTLPLAAAQRVYPALIGAQSREDVARLNKELIPTAQGLYRTGYLTGQDPGLVPGTERGTYVDDALIAEYPQLGPAKGQWIPTSQLMRAYGQRLETAPTTTTTYDPILQTTTVTHRYKNVPGSPATTPPGATAPAPPAVALPGIPQPVQSPLLPGFGQSQLQNMPPAVRDYLVQNGIFPPGTLPSGATTGTTTPPAAVALAPAPTAPAATMPAAPVPATTPTATAVGPVIPPAPPGVPPAIWQAGVKLATGYGNPNVASRSKYGTAILDAADTYSRQTTGKPYDQAKDVINFNFANQPQTQNTLNFLNSLVGRDNKGGNLQALINMSDSLALARFQWPAANDLLAWTRLQSGSGPQAAYAALALESADQVGKILAGGSQGTTSDKKLNDAQSLFQKGFNTEQMRDVAGALRTALANRKTEMIGDNPYLLRMYGQAAQRTQPSAGPNFFQQFGGAPR